MLLHLPQVVLIGLLVGASIFDLLLRRVPNTLTLVGSTAALLLVLTGFSEITLTQALTGGLIGLGLFLIPYALGQMGAGDVKLFGMCGLFLGPIPVISAALYTMLAGGGLALSYLLRSKCTPKRKTIDTVPYAVAISLGVMLVLAGY